MSDVPGPVVLSPTAAQLSAAVAALRAHNVDLVAAKAAKAKPTAPTWRVVPKAMREHPSTGAPVEVGGVMAANGIYGGQMPMALKPEDMLRLFDPAFALEGLKLLQAKMLADPDGMRFKDKESQEAAQVRLDELVRMYGNLV